MNRYSLIQWIFIYIFVDYVFCSWMESNFYPLNIIVCNKIVKHIIGLLYEFFGDNVICQRNMT